MGFEPTVGFPTLDFESSALNRTQPPFLEVKENVQRPTSNTQFRMQVTQTIVSAKIFLGVALSVAAALGKGGSSPPGEGRFGDLPS